MARMFHESTDENGVTYSSNCHPAQEYTQPPSDQRQASPHWMAGEDGHGGYLEPAAKTLAHKTKDRVLTQLGRNGGGMTFEGDLLPRSERLPREEAGKGVEVHAPGCWCDLCQSPMSQMANPGIAPRRYRK